MLHAARLAPALWSGVVLGLGLLAASALATPASAQDPAAPDGFWYTKGEQSIIKVHPCAAEPNAYCGTLVWLKEPNEADGSPKLDKLNKDPVKRTKPLVGVEILRDMKPDDGRWKGKAYNAEDGKIYDITFKVKGEDAADLRGCILGFLCQTDTFKRATGVPADSSADAKKHKVKTSAHR